MKLKKLLKIMPNAKVKFINNNKDYYTVTLELIPYLKSELLEKKVRDIYAYSDTIYIYLEE